MGRQYIAPGAWHAARWWLLAAAIAWSGAVAADGSLALTHQRLDGNRLLDGAGPGAAARVVDVVLPGTPAWVLARTTGDGVGWLVALDDGRLVRIEVGADGRVGAPRVDEVRLAPGAPPAARVGGRGLEPLLPPPASSRATHPVEIDGQTLSITAGGRLAVGGTVGPPVLADARILVSGTRALVLGEPTDVYAHGVLGDATEAGAALLLERGSLAPVARIAPPAGRVIEAIAPIWADLDGDARPEIVLTESDVREGARLTAYDGDGRPLAESPPIGLGFRWRHAIGVARTVAGQPPELVAVRTPHLAGAVEFFRLEGRRLVEQARHPGASSHGLGSRNLDMALLADWDGDGGVDVLVPDLAHEVLLVVSRRGGGTVEQARLEAGGRIVSNLAGASVAGAPLHVGAGTADGRLRLWGPLYSVEE